MAENPYARIGFNDGVGGTMSVEVKVFGTSGANYYTDAEMGALVRDAIDADGKTIVSDVLVETTETNLP